MSELFIFQRVDRRAYRHTTAIRRFARTHVSRKNVARITAYIYVTCFFFFMRRTIVNRTAKRPGFTGKGRENVSSGLYLAPFLNISLKRDPLVTACVCAIIFFIRTTFLVRKSYRFETTRCSLRSRPCEFAVRTTFPTVYWSE